jgi:hypothetical protein
MKSLIRKITLGVSAAGIIAGSAFAGSSTYSTSGLGPQSNSTEVTTPSATSVSESITISGATNNSGCGNVEATAENHTGYSLEVSQI